MNVPAWGEVVCCFSIMQYDLIMGIIRVTEVQPSACQGGLSAWPGKPDPDLAGRDPPTRQVAGSMHACASNYIAMITLPCSFFVNSLCAWAELP